MLFPADNERSETKRAETETSELKLTGEEGRVERGFLISTIVFCSD